MKRNEDANNLLKQVTSAALRALAGRSDVGISYGGNEADVRGNRVRMPSPAARCGQADVARLRGTADALALLLRYHDNALHRRRMPLGQPARAIFDGMERVKYFPALRSRHPFSGVASNIEAMVDHTCRAKGYAKVQGRDEATLADALGLIVRERLTGMHPPALAAPLVDPWRPVVAERCGTYLRRMSESLGDQAAFAEAAAQMIHALGLIDDNDPSLDQDSDEQSGDQARQSPSDEKTRTQGTESGCESRLMASGGAALEQGEASGEKTLGEDTIPGESGAAPAGPSARQIVARMPPRSAKPIAPIRPASTK